MKRYKVAAMQIEKENVAVIWIDIKYKTKERDVQNYLEFFRKILDVNEIVIFMVDMLDQTIYYGRPDIVEKLKKNSWRKFPWHEYVLEES